MIHEFLRQVCKSNKEEARSSTKWNMKIANPTNGKLEGKIRDGVQKLVMKRNPTRDQLLRIQLQQQQQQQGVKMTKLEHFTQW